MPCRVIAIILVAILLHGPLTRAQHNRVRSEATLRQLEQDIAAATRQGEWQRIDQALAPEWTAIDIFGRQIDKPTALASLKSRSGPSNPLKVYDVEVRFLKDDIAIVTERIAFATGAEGKEGNATARGTDIFVYRQGKWLVVASQLTLVK